MKQISIILIVLLQAFFSFGQVVDFKQMSFDLSKLDYKNEYSEFRYDTIEYPGEEHRWLWVFGKGVYASRNHEYFLLVNDSQSIGPIGQGIGSDVSPNTDYFYYHKNTLLWQDYMNNGIRDVHFFENDGSVIIKWFETYEYENYSFFYDKQGNILDTISGDVQIFDLDNNLKLIQYYVQPIYGNNGVHRIWCLDSRCRKLWEDSIVLRPGQFRGLDVTNKGSIFSIHTNDSTWTFDSNHNLLWKRCREKYTGNGYYVGSGDYIAGKKYKPDDKGSWITEPELYIYNSKTGNLVKRIDTIYYSNTFLVSLSPKLVMNSEYVYYENIFWDIKKCDIVITDIMGKVILFKSFSLNNEPDRIEYNKGFNLYLNKNLIETIKY
jgi:hypothetical protein